MSARPILVFQTQRLGDIVLTLPLLRQLSIQFPQSPLLLAAQPQFYHGLQPLFPGLAFVDITAPTRLPSRYAAVLNLGSLPAAARFTAKVQAELKLGARQQDDITRISGFWQLYRGALTHNNRHNTFHWADLNRMDLPRQTLAPGALARPGSGRVGLFLGASEAAKRPDREFWIALVQRLHSRGLAPVLLGGNAEMQMGEAVQSGCGISVPNLAGRTSIAALARVLQTLDLLITPDTGPMHLADWLGVPVLNLSMGNVSAAETGPLSPGQHILQAAISCAGCWRCSRGRQYCKPKFDARAVARVACALASGESPVRFPGMRLYKTGLDEFGLHTLHAGGAPATARDLADNFWRACFLHFSAPSFPAASAQAAALVSQHPALAVSMLRSISDMLRSLLASLKGRETLGAQFWETQPAHTRLFAGFTHMMLENADFSRQAVHEAASSMAHLRDILAR